jgi:hypothetical protein
MENKMDTICNVIYNSNDVLVEYNNYRIVPVNKKFVLLWASDRTGNDAGYLGSFDTLNMAVRDLIYKLT